MQSNNLDNSQQIESYDQSISYEEGKEGGDADDSLLLA